MVSIISFPFEKFEILSLDYCCLVSCMISLQESERPRRTPRKSVRLDEKKDAPNQQPANMEDSPPTPTPMAPPIRLPVAKPAVAPQPQPSNAGKQPEQVNLKTTPFIIGWNVTFGKLLWVNTGGYLRHLRTLWLTHYGSYIVICHI